VRPPMVVAGLSMGGPVAARYTILHPEKVAGLILIAPEVSPISWKDIFPLNLPVVGDYLMAAVMEPIILPKLQAADFVHPEKFPDWESRYRVQLRYQGTGRALLSTIRNLTSTNPTEVYRHLGDLDIPVLLVWGKDDTTIGEDQISLLQHLVPDIQTFVVDDAGHLPHYERADLVNPRLLQFLSEVLPMRAAGD
jgi:pimeloyl-ACP methyl ester carboxylesterase